MIVIMIVPTLIASRPIMQNNRRSRPEIDYGAGGLRHAFQPGPLLLSLIFGLYASQYLIIVGFLPILLIELNGLGAFAAATVCAIVVFLNAGGNATFGVVSQSKLSFFNFGSDWHNRHGYLWCADFCS